MKPTTILLLSALLVLAPAVGAGTDPGCDTCRVSLKPLDLSEPPNDLDLVRSGQFGGSLSPTVSGRPSPPADRLLFGQAMDAWNRHDYRRAVSLFQKHIEKFPNSVWKGEAELHLGCEARFNGRYAEAEEYFNRIVADYGEHVGTSGEIALKARLRLAMLEFLRGNFEKAQAIWLEMARNDLDRRRRDHARFWLMRSTLHQAEAKWVRRCALESLVYLLARNGNVAGAEALRTIPANPAYGFRADELVGLAAEHGLALTGVRAETPTAIPTPFIAHYRFGHFVSVTARDTEGNLELFDPILNLTVRMRPAQFAREWSGVALVPTGTIARMEPSAARREAPAGDAQISLTRLSLSELSAFAGGCCGVENVNQDEGCNTGSKCGGDINQMGDWNVPAFVTGLAMPVWGFTPMSMNLFIKDAPLWYQPAIGPAIVFSMAYNSIDADAGLSSFGEKWFFAYHSYAVETPAMGSGTVTVFMPDGRNDVYSPAGETNYTAPARVFNKLTRIATNQYALQFPDGTVWQFGAPAGATNVQQALLKQVSDRHTNTVTLLYDGEPDPKLTAVVDALSQTSHIYYAASGLITNISDPFGRSAIFTYSTNGCLASVTDMGGITSEYEFYDAAPAEDYIKSLRTRSGKVTFTYGFQDEGWWGMWERQCITATFTNGATEVLYYNGGEDANPSTFFTNRNGHQTRYKLGLNVAFPYQGSIVYEDAPDGSRVSYLYNSALQPTNITDEAGQVWRFGYNSAGRLTNSVEPNGYQASFTYTNSDFDLYQAWEGTNLLATFAYSANRELISVSNALSQVTRFNYDSYGRLTNCVDALSITNLYEYGTDKRLARVRRAGAVLATLQYDAAGRLTNYTGPEGVSMAAAFDGLDRMTNLAVGAESPYRWTYPTNSLLLGQVADRSGRRSQFSYDVMNRLAGVKSPDYSLTTFEYDNADNLSALIDAEVHRTRFAYDSRERPIRKTYADGASNQVSWTSRSLLNTFVSPRGITNAYAYDASGLLTNVAYSGITNTPNVRFRYDSYNRLTNSVDGWATNRLTYDLLGRLTQWKEVQGAFTQTFAYVYDAGGRLTNVTWTAGTNAAVATTYRYDALNRITNVLSDVGLFRYAYATNGLTVKTLTYPNAETANCAYDGLLRLTNLLYKAAGTTNGWSYGYDSRDQVTSRVDPATNNCAYRYDDAGRLVEATGTKGTNTTQGYPFRYTYDRVGNRTRQTEGSQQRTLAYNNLNQLVSFGRSNEASVAGWVNEAGTGTVVETRATTTGAWVRVPTRYVNYTQAWFEATVTLTNAVGTNTIWIRATDKSGNASTQTVHVSNSSTNLAYQYDADGNTTNSQGAKLQWDAENRLVRVVYPNNSQTRLRYDGFGRLREIAEYNASTNLTGTTRFAWNGWLPWAELNENNAIVRTFTWGLDLGGTVGGAGGVGGLLGLRDRAGAGTNFLVRSDGKGNVTEVRRTNGTVVATYTYAPFGNIITNTGSYSQPFRFQSKLYHSKSGLSYFGYRLYDARVGRWISRDGLGEAGGVNLYLYCNGSPLVLVDPFGLTDYTELQTRGWLNEAYVLATAGPIQGLRNIDRLSRGGGPYDFGYDPRYENDTWRYNGRVMNADSFANFMVGFEAGAYDANYSGSLHAALGVAEGFGVAAHLLGRTKAVHDPWDYTGMPDIIAGAEAAERFYDSQLIYGPNKRRAGVGTDQTQCP